MSLVTKHRSSGIGATNLRSPIIMMLLLSAASCALRTPLDAQRDLASALTPDVPVRQEARRAATDIVRVRAYLDDDFRRQNLHAEARVRAAFEEASLHLAHALGLAFEIVAVLPWERRGDGLTEALVELARTDPGEGIDFVVGFVAAAPKWTSTLHDLGRAHLLGRHAVLRGMNDLEERRAIEEALRMLSREEHEEIYRARRLHKEVAVLLHEWGHTAGGMHVSDPTDFMNPQHDVLQQRFATASLPVLGLGARWHRAADDDERRRIATALAEATTGQGAPYSVESRQRLLAVVARYLPAGERLDMVEEEAPLPVGRGRQTRAHLAPDERAALDAARQFLSSGDMGKAWPRLRPLINKYPEDSVIQRLGCIATQGQSLLAAERGAPCRRAIALDTSDALAPLVLAKLALDGHDVEAGQRWVDEALLRLERAPPDDARQWLQLAVLARALRRVTDAEKATRRAPDGPIATEVKEWAGVTRRRFGMPEPPAPGSIDRVHDAAYLQVFDDVYRALGGNDLSGASRACDKGLARFGEVPGLLALRCDLHLRAGRSKVAAPFCSRALELYEEATVAHVASAMLAYRRGRVEDALRHARRALELDPTHAPTWELLAQLYRRSGRASEVSAIEADYQARFGEPLDQR